MEKNDKVRNVLCPFLRTLSHLNMMGGIFACVFNTVATANIHIMLGFFYMDIDVTSKLFQQINRHYFLALNLFVKLFLVSASYLMTHFILPARYKLPLALGKNVCTGLTLRNQ